MSLYVYQAELLRVVEPVGTVRFKLPLESTEATNRPKDVFIVWKYYEDDGTWRMDEHDEKIRSEYEQDLNEEVANIEEEKKRSILDVLENGSSDKLWSLLADYGMCSNYDYEGIKRALGKFVEKLKKSNYNRDGVI